MAALAISAAGAGIGSALGLSGQTGWLIGSIIGKLLFPETLPDVVNKGPRLGDLTVTASTYGQAIPIAYGTVRLGGNMIWTAGIKEKKRKKTTTTGGKGGQPEQKTTSITFTYSDDFAIAFAEAEAEDVLKIWADGKLIFDKTGIGKLTRKKGLNFNFYTGSETQVPDATIEADKGVGNVPAHRGMVYIVFPKLQLRNFGNRIPNITAQIAFKVTNIFPGVELSAPGSGITDIVGQQMGYDYRRATA